MPALDVSEITLIGTGGGYGESVVIHLADNHWIVVDSCIDPTSKASLPMQYLRDKGVDLSKDVKLIICTHWHNDHILGLYELFEACTSAEFCFAPCHDVQKFLFLVSLDYKKAERGIPNSSTTIFIKCIELARHRKVRVKRAVQDKLLYKHKEYEIFALSPSDYTLEKYDEEVSTLITEFGNTDKRIITSSPNSKSIALYVKLNNHRAILGADLEVSNDAREGWINIIDNCTKTVIDQKASLFKVPHHGSENGYHIDIWNTLLTEQVNANLTPWNRKQKLPTTQMLEVMYGHTDKLYITSNVIGSKPKKREKGIEKFIQQINPSLREVKFRYGLIRCTIEGKDPKGKWATFTEGSAMPASQVLREMRTTSL